MNTKETGRCSINTVYYYCVRLWNSVITLAKERGLSAEPSLETLKKTNDSNKTKTNKSTSIFFLLQIRLLKGRDPVNVAHGTHFGNMIRFVLSFRRCQNPPNNDCSWSLNYLPLLFSVRFSSLSQCRWAF